MALSDDDKRWLIKMCGTMIYYLITCVRYTGKPVSQQGTIKFLFEDLLPK